MRNLRFHRRFVRRATTQWENAITVCCHSEEESSIKHETHGQALPPATLAEAEPNQEDWKLEPGFRNVGSKIQEQEFGLCSFVTVLPLSLRNFMLWPFQSHSHHVSRIALAVFLRLLIISRDADKQAGQLRNGETLVDHQGAGKTRFCLQLLPDLHHCFCAFQPPRRSIGHSGHWCNRLLLVLATTTNQSLITSCSLLMKLHTETAEEAVRRRKSSKIQQFATSAGLNSYRLES